MATVAVQLVGRAPTSTRRRVVLSGYNGRVTLELKGATSPEVDVDNVAAEWVEVERPGRPALTAYGGPRLRRLSLEATIDHGDPVGKSVETDLLILAGFANSDAPVLLTYAPLEARTTITRSGRWVIADLRYRSLRRRPVDNAISRARISLELLEHSPAEPATTVGPPPPAAPARPATPTGSSPGYLGLTPEQWRWLEEQKRAGGATTRRHTVARGETLWAIAVRYYGDGNRWTAIAQANGIRDPRRLAVGQVLTIPG